MVLLPPKCISQWAERRSHPLLFPKTLSPVPLCKGLLQWPVEVTFVVMVFNCKLKRKPLQEEHIYPPRVQVCRNARCR